MRITEFSDGLIGFQITSETPTPATTKLHDRVHGFLLTHRGVKVIAALPWTSNGETIAVHLWTEGGDD